MEMFNNILNNSKNKKIIRFKRIYYERERLKYITHFTAEIDIDIMVLKKVKYIIYKIKKLDLL